MRTPDLSLVLRTNDCSVPSLSNSSDIAKQALVKPANEAMLVAEAFPVATLASLGKKNLGSLVEPTGFKAFRDNFLKEFGSPENPLVILMIDQLLWAHFRVADLHALSAGAGAPEVAAIYSVAAAKLMGEFRRSSLAVAELQSAKQPQTGVPQQQDSEPGEVAGQPAKKTADIEVGGNDAEQPLTLAPTDCGEAQPAEARKPHGRGAAEAA